MGGGGGGGYKPPSIKELQKLVDHAHQEEEAELHKSIDNYLQELLVRFNDRDVETTRERLEKIEESLGLDLENLLFGGSVAKHTYVDGLSDVDAIVLIDRENTQGFSAQDALQQCFEDIDTNLPRDSGVLEVRRGDLAVTITYKDGAEIQILPGVRLGEEVRIPDASGQGWKVTHPQVFREKLTEQNQRLSNNLVPAIKIVKALVSDLPNQQRPTGYHVESLAVDAVKDYTGDSSTRVLIDRILDSSTRRVLLPIADVTGQSRIVDEYLGAKESVNRQLVSQGLGAIRRRLNAATSATQWEVMLARRDD